MHAKRLLWQFLLIAGFFLVAFSGHGTIIHIPGDVPRIQGAFDMAQTGDTLLVAPGTYQENMITQGRGVVLASEYILTPDSSLIDSTILAPLESGSILEVYGPLSADMSIIGLTFIHGSNVEPNGWGGAVFIDSASVGFRNCKFRENEAIRGGGIYAQYSQISIEESRFQSNFSDGYGGAIEIFQGVVSILNNSFTGNHTGNVGGALKTGVASGVIEQNVFNGNYTTLPVTSNGGGALKCSSNDSYGIPTSIRIVSNSFEDNHARLGGAIHVGGIDSLHILDNLFRHNRTQDPLNQGRGGAIYNGPECGFVEVMHNEFYHNFAANQSGALQVMSSVLVEDNLFYQNHTMYFGYAAATQFGNNNVDMVAEFTNNLFFANYKTDYLYPLNHGCVQVNQYNTATFHLNDFIGNVPYAAGQHPQYGGTIDVENNYWGDPTGPYHETQNPEGLGDSVMVELNVLPFATEPFTTRWLRAPEPLELILPEAGAFIGEDMIQFLWHAAADSTPHDTLRYTLEIADNPEFTDALIVDTDLDTTTIVADFVMESAYYWRVQARDIYDLVTYSAETRQFLVTSVDENDSDTLPTEWVIDQIYPNPFNSAVQIAISVPQRDDVRITIYDLQGRLVDTIQRGPLSTGHHRFVWWPNGAAGMYFVRVSAGSWEEIRKVVYIK